MLLFWKKVIAGHGGASLLLNHFSKSMQISAPLYPQPQYILVEASSYTFSHVLLALLKYSTHVLLGHLPSVLPAGMGKLMLVLYWARSFHCPTQNQHQCYLFHQRTGQLPQRCMYGIFEYPVGHVRKCS